MVDAKLEAAVDAIADAGTWNERVRLIMAIPSAFGSAQHPAVYAAIAARVYVPHLAPDFAYMHWRPDYELPTVLEAYDLAHRLTEGFTKVDEESLATTITAEPKTLRIFRLLLGFTPPEFASSTVISAELLSFPAALGVGKIKSMELGRRTTQADARMAAIVVDRAMRGVLFPAPEGVVKNKIDKPDTAKGWESVRGYAANGVPYAVFLHQRHYGGAFRQILDATSGKRGDLLEDAVATLFEANGVAFMRTGPANHKLIEEQYGLTVKPAPDFLVQDAAGSLKAILECKQVNDGGTARDKASRFAGLRSESIRLGGIPVFAVLAGLGWRRTADTLGPVVRDTSGRVFTLQTLGDMLEVEPFPQLVAR